MTYNAMAQKRYRATPRGREVLRRALAKYAKSAKGRATQRRTYKKRYANPRTRAAILAGNKRRYDARRSYERLKRWFQTDKGRKYVRRHRHRLGADAPEWLVAVCEKLYTLRKELRK